MTGKGQRISVETARWAVTPARQPEATCPLGSQNVGFIGLSEGARADTRGGYMILG